MNGENGLVHVPQGPDAGAIARQEFGATQMQRVAETAATAIAAQARAQVEARYVMALQRPRDMETVRVRLLRECHRPGFAATARYRKPVGGQSIEGWSIRFAEAAMRYYGNLLPEVIVIYDDSRQRIIRVALTDLESNLSYVRDVVVAKVVERRTVRAGQQVLSSRQNSSGQVVHLVVASDDDLANKEGALISKTLRNHALRMIPGDVLEDCLEAVQKTINTVDAADPAAAVKKLVDAFAAINVLPAALRDYLGHDIEQTSPAELTDLRTVYQAVKDGETSWAAISEARAEEREAGKKPEKKAEASPSAPPRTVEDLKARERKTMTVKGSDGKPIETTTSREPGSDDE